MKQVSRHSAQSHTHYFCIENFQVNRKRGKKKKKKKHTHTENTFCSKACEGRSLRIDVLQQSCVDPEWVLAISWDSARGSSADPLSTRGVTLTRHPPSVHIQSSHVSMFWSSFSQRQENNFHVHKKRKASTILNCSSNTTTILACLFQEQRACGYFPGVTYSQREKIVLN